MSYDPLGFMLFLILDIMNHSAKNDLCICVFLFYGHLYSIDLGLYLRVELVDNLLTLCLISRAPVKFNFKASRS